MSLPSLFFYLRVKILLLSKFYKHAENLCTIYSAKYPYSDLVQNLLAITLEKNNKIQDAAKAYEKLLNMSPDEPSNYRDAVRALFRSNEYEATVKYCTEFLNKKFNGLRQHLKSSFFDEIYWYLAFSYYSLKNYNEAKIYFEKIRHIKKWEQEYNISRYIKSCIGEESYGTTKKNNPPLRF